MCKVSNGSSYKLETYDRLQITKNLDNARRGKTRRGGTQIRSCPLVLKIKYCIRICIYIYIYHFISKDEYQQATLLFYHRSYEEYMAPFASADSARRKCGLKLVSAESKDVTAGLYRFWPNDDDGNHYA